MAILWMLPFVCVAASEKKYDGVTIMSYNIRCDSGKHKDGTNSWEFRWKSVINMIDACGADVIGLQEVTPFQLPLLKDYCEKYRFKGVGRDDGKKKGEPLLADCIGATPGRDTNGPTALINSVLRYRHDDCGSGFVFQTKYNKSLFATEQGRNTFIALAKAFFEGGGQQFTASVVSPEDLQDAKLHPENHRDLIVRVGGYSDYFVNLTADLQDSVLERTFLEM